MIYGKRRREKAKEVGHRATGTVAGARTDRWAPGGRNRAVDPPCVLWSAGEMSGRVGIGGGGGGLRARVCVCVVLGAAAMLLLCLVFVGVGSWCW